MRSNRENPKLFEDSNEGDLVDIQIDRKCKDAIDELIEIHQLVQTQYQRSS